MEGPTVALIAAMPDEVRPLIRLKGEVRRERIGRFPCRRFMVGNRTVIVVESGMGTRNAAQATSELLAQIRADSIINFGFAGAATPALAVGDVVVATRLLFRHDRLFSEQQGLDERLTVQAVESGKFIPSQRLVGGTFITTAGIAPKKEVAEQLPAGATFPVLEMETSAVAQVALKAGIPFAAVRAISDDFHEELGFNITEFTDNKLKISIPRVILTIARRPRILPQLVRLSQNSALAGENLATFLLNFLDHL